MKKNNCLFIYFLSHFLFLGGGFARICELSNTDTCIAFILGTLLGIIIIYLINKVSCNIPLKEYIKKNTFLNILFKLIFFLYISFNLLILFVILSGFLYSYFLPFTPSIISCLPFVILATYLSGKKIKGIYNVAFVLLFLSLFIIILKTTLLTNEFHYSNLFPILSVKYCRDDTGCFRGNDRISGHYPESDRYSRNPRDGGCSGKNRRRTGD